MLSHCCSSSDFFQSHYTILLSKFLLPFICTSWCCCSLLCISQILQIWIFSLSVLSSCHTNQEFLLWPSIFFFWQCLQRISLAVSVTAVMKVVIIESMYLQCSTSFFPSSHLIYPLTVRAIGAPQMISQPVSSIFPCSSLPSGTYQTPGLSIPWCCLPTSSSVCFVFFSLSLCLARWFWPDLANRRHDHTTAVCISLRWSGGLHVVQLPAGS